MAAGDPILAVRNLRVRFRTLDGAVEAVKGINLHVDAGETVAIVGESGSGKSQTMMAAMSLLASNGEATGTVDYRGTNLLTLSKRDLNQVRGRKISMIFQEPMTSLDPLYSIGSQLMEPIRRHRGLSAAEARTEALRLLDLVSIPEPQRRFKSYPYEMSGGQRQRVMIAMALANNPDILIADEPTTALDVTVQAQILQLLAELQKRLGMAIVFITHDLGIVRRLADRVYVMRSGEVVEEGATEAIFSAPKHDYTRMLLAAEPTGRKQPPPDGAPVMLEGRNVAVTFSIGGGFLAGPPMILRAVDGISVALRQQQTIGIVGESGSGKSTLGRALLRLLPSEGVIRFDRRDIDKADREAMQPLRRELQLVFQDPFGSLSPRMTVGQIVTEGLLVHEPSLSKAERDRRAIEALQRGRARPGDAQPLSARIFRRTAPAHRDCPRHDSQAEGGRARRADLGARPFRAETDRRTAARPAAGARAFLSLHQPRSRGGARDGRLHHRDARGQDRGRGADGGDFRPSEPGLYPHIDGGSDGRHPVQRRSRLERHAERWKPAFSRSDAQTKN